MHDASNYPDAYIDAGNKSNLTSLFFNDDLKLDDVDTKNAESSCYDEII